MDNITKIMIILCIFLMGFGTGTISVQNVNIEREILLNQLDERRMFSSRETWTLEEWLPLKNSYLENYYNLLLKYDNPQLSAEIIKQGECLELLNDAKLRNVDVNTYNSIVDACNRFGDNIKELFYDELMSD